VPGSNVVERGHPRYAAPGAEDPSGTGIVDLGPVYISSDNRTGSVRGQYFRGVSPEAWSFRIRGYQVCEKVAKGSAWPFASGRPRSPTTSRRCAFSGATRMLPPLQHGVRIRLPARYSEPLEDQPRIADFTGCSGTSCQARSKVHPVAPVENAPPARGWRRVERRGGEPVGRAAAAFGAGAPPHGVGGALALRPRRVGEVVPRTNRATRPRRAAHHPLRPRQRRMGTA
jgi:hypothetical protein